MHVFHIFRRSVIAKTFKTFFRLCLIYTVLVVACVNSVSAIQEQDSTKGPNSKVKFLVNADLFSNYIWRGTKYGDGPSVQPSVKLQPGGLTLGVWGSFDTSGYMETDPYISYNFPFGLSLGATDYYYPFLEGSFFSDSANAYEINLGYAFKGLNLSANYIINEASVAGSSGNDLYFQAVYTFKDFNAGIGAGNGWHTHDAQFNVCYVAFGV